MPDIFSPSPTTPSAPTTQPTTPPPPQPIDPTAPTSPLIKDETHIHAFAAFCQNPQGVSFQTQEADENILLFLRRHFVTNVPWIVSSIFFFFLPFLIAIVIPLTAVSPSIPPNFITVFIIFYYLILFAYVFINFLTWFYNISFVTNKRVVDIDFSELVYKNVSATKLSLVQDVSYTQVGVIRSIFDYGDVLVQTAGTMENFDLLAVPQPQHVVTIIEDLIGRRGRGV